ncbi:MAG: GTP-binding protein [Pseudomonadota bacterium]
MTCIPVTILTGFLGSGKTTLLNALLRDPAFAQSAVLINEFGDVQIDHDLVEEFSAGMITTTTGCLCCTASSDIKRSLFDISQKRSDGRIGPYKRVIVETTGLMDPVPVINTLLSLPSIGFMERIVSQEFALSRVVTLFDIVNGPLTLDRYLEALKQVALADTVIFTKTDMAHDLATRHDIKESKQRVNAINPGAVILDRHADGSQIAERLLTPVTYDLRGKGEDAQEWLKADHVSHDHGHGHAHGNGHHHDHDHGHPHHDPNRHGDDISSHVIALDAPVTRPAFKKFMKTLKANAGTDLLRLKGLVALADEPERPIVVHGVQHLIHEVGELERWPSEDRQTRVVLIGRNLDVDRFRKVLSSTR